jgi:hypothetical protein
MIIDTPAGVTVLILKSGRPILEAVPDRHPAALF